MGWAVAVFAVGKKVLLQSQWEELELAGSEILSSNGDEDHGNKMEMFPQEITFRFRSDLIDMVRICGYGLLPRIFYGMLMTRTTSSQKASKGKRAIGFL